MDKRADQRVAPSEMQARAPTFPTGNSGGARHLPSKKGAVACARFCVDSRLRPRGLLFVLCTLGGHCLDGEAQQFANAGVLLPGVALKSGTLVGGDTH